MTLSKSKRQLLLLKSHRKEIPNVFKSRWKGTNAFWVVEEQVSVHLTVLKDASAICSSMFPNKG